MSMHASHLNVARSGIGHSPGGLQGRYRGAWVMALLIPVALSRMTWPVVLLVGAWVVLVCALLYAMRGPR